MFLLSQVLTSIYIYNNFSYLEKKPQFFSLLHLAQYNYKAWVFCFYRNLHKFFFVHTNLFSLFKLKLQYHEFFFFEEGNLPSFGKRHLKRKRLKARHTLQFLLYPRTQQIKYFHFNAHISLLAWELQNFQLQRVTKFKFSALTFLSNQAHCVNTSLLIKNAWHLCFRLYGAFFNLIDIKSNTTLKHKNWFWANSYFYNVNAAKYHLDARDVFTNILFLYLLFVRVFIKKKKLHYGALEDTDTFWIRNAVSPPITCMSTFIIKWEKALIPFIYSPGSNFLFFRVTGAELMEINFQKLPLKSLISYSSILKNSFFTFSKSATLQDLTLVNSGFLSFLLKVFSFFFSLHKNKRKTSSPLKRKMKITFYTPQIVITLYAIRRTLNIVKYFSTRHFYPWLLFLQTNIIFQKNKFGTSIMEKHLFMGNNSYNTVTGFINIFLFLNNKFFLNPAMNYLFIYKIRKLTSVFNNKYFLQRLILKRYTKQFFYFWVNDRLLYPLVTQPFLQGTSYLPQQAQDSFAFLKPYNNALNWVTYASFFSKQLDSRLNTEIHLRRIRFKPGYSILWRNARTDFKQTWALAFRYQKKLTTYLAYFNRYVTYKLFLQNEFQLRNILLKSRLFPTMYYAELFLANNWIFLNGGVINNKFFQVFINDFIQLIVNFRYYIVYKWLLNWSLKRTRRLKKRIWRLNNSYFLSAEKQRANHFPNWILFSKNIFDDVNNYLEVDFFTLSLIILYEPFLFTDLNIYNIYDLKINIINLYNWKYIT